MHFITYHIQKQLEGFISETAINKSTTTQLHHLIAPRLPLTTLKLFALSGGCSSYVVVTALVTPMAPPAFTRLGMTATGLFSIYIALLKVYSSRRAAIDSSKLLLQCVVTKGCICNGSFMAVNEKWYDTSIEILSKYLVPHGKVSFVYDGWKLTVAMTSVDII